MFLLIWICSENNIISFWGYFGNFSFSVMQATAAVLVPRNQHDWTVDSKLHQGDPLQVQTGNYWGLIFANKSRKVEIFHKTGNFGWPGLVYVALIKFACQASFIFQTIWFCFWLFVTGSFDEKTLQTSNPATVWLISWPPISSYLRFYKSYK